MGANKEKVQIFLASVINNCKLSKPFKMHEITKLVGITSNAGTIIKRLNMIERSHNRGEVGHEWIWKASGLESLPQLTETVSRALDGYQSTFNNTDRQHSQPSIGNLGFPGAFQNENMKQSRHEARNEESARVNYLPGIQVYVQHPTGELTPVDKLTLPLKTISKEVAVTRHPLPDIKSPESEAALAGCMEPGFTGSHLGPDAVSSDAPENLKAVGPEIDFVAAIADIQRKVDAIYHVVMPHVPCKQ